ncbi:MAG: helix-turn-helix transcriptional regulator [Elusimicrobiota bacterium]|nr:helix-turn-helix transcriptional regulator [Elusimicrobiota bacterium]
MMLQQGKKVKEAREKKGLTVAEVSDKLKIPADKIKAIENGETAKFPDKFYAERFLKTYADFLEVRIDIPAAESNNPVSFPGRKAEKKKNIKKLFSITAGAIIAAGIGLLILGPGEDMISSLKEEYFSPDEEQIVPAAGQLEPRERTIQAVPEEPVWLSINREGEEIFSGIITEPAEWQVRGETTMRVGNVYGLKLYIKSGEEYFKELDIEEGSSQGVNTIIITDDLSQ